MFAQPKQRSVAPAARSSLQSAPVLRFALPLLVGLLLAPQPAQAVDLKLASLAPTDSAWGRLIQEMASEVSKATGGAVNFKLFLGGKLGDEAKVTKKLGKGLDGAFFTGQGMGLLHPPFRVQELPFLVENYAEADTIRRTLWADFEADFEKNTNYVLLGGGETGQVYIFSKEPIDGVEAMRKSKLWVWEGDKVASDTFKVFGVSPIPLDILTVVQQIKNGGINAVYNSPAGAVALGWSGDLSYMTERAVAYASGGFVVTKDGWAKVPTEHQATVKKLVQTYGEKIIAQARADNDAAFKRLLGEGGGLKKVAISDAKYAEFKKVGSAAWPDLAKSLNAGAYLDKARAALKK